MAHSIESRVPFTDMKVFDVARMLPKNYKVSDGTTKVALRNAARKVIPNDAWKKKKLGFPVPIREWIREEDFYKEIKNTFNTDISKELFNNDYLIKILDEHKNREKDNYRKIWAVYSFLKWYDEYFVKRQKNSKYLRKIKKTLAKKVKYVYNISDRRAVTTSGRW